jgi:acyl-coenzyme A synthetase/AMP-(fatty) acid ligase
MNKLMTFGNVLEQIAASTDASKNTLTDGQLSCSYGELPDLTRKIDQHLTEQGIDTSVCLAAECINSVPGALLLLTLLQRGNSFALVPSVDGQSLLKPPPSFCSYRLTVLPLETREAAESFPMSVFRIEANPLYNGKAAGAGKLYLRTSGSMGASKIVVHSHEKLLGNARNVAEKYKFTASSRAVIPVPIAHMYGFGAEFLPAVLSGAAIDLQEKTNVLKYLEREKRFQPTIAFATPAVCEMLLKGYKAPRTHYDVFVTSGQRIGNELFRAFDACVGGRLVNQYGSTEMGATAACDPGDDLEDRIASIGKPMGGVQLRLMQQEAGAADGAWHLYCQHPYGFEGYLDDNGDWIQQMAPDHWYRTGDLAVTRQDGSIVVVWRADASVNRSGYLVLLSDIELMMQTLRSVAEVAVVLGKGHGRQGQRIAAFCVPQPGSLLSGAQVRELCFEVLPHYAIPDEVRVIDMLPLLPSGKADRQALTAMIQ